MNPRRIFWGSAAAVLVALGMLVFTPQPVRAHCDTLDGPVVMTATQALEKGDVTPVLKWGKKEHEGEIRGLFQKTLAVRSKGPEAREIADRHFLETLVRLHRAGEGAPYTGLSGEPVEPIIAAADSALEKGTADRLVKHVAEAAAKGIRERFTRTLEKKKHADESVEAGREFVEAYVDFTHYVERLHLNAAGPAGHGQEAQGGAHKH